tara:strand:- start:10424 stop:12916 length:2493 start_codon:yes stop_codon:yes gene_type:complete
MFEKFGEQIAKFLGERTDYGVRMSSPSIETQREFLETYHIQDLLPYETYDAANQIFINKDSIGFVIETKPMVGCSEENQTEISALFQNILPEGGNLQCMLWADPRIGDFIDRWQGAREGRGEVFEYLAKQRAKFLKDQIYKGGDNQTFRNFRSIFAYSEPLDKKGLSKRQEQDINALKKQVLRVFKTLKLPAFVWQPEDLINTLDGIINFRHTPEVSKIKWNKYQEISDQIPSSETSIQVDKKGLVLDEGKYLIKTYQLKSEPDYWNLHMMGELIGDPFRDTARINIPFLIHYGVHVPPQGMASNKLLMGQDYLEMQAKSKLGKKLPGIQNKYKEVEYLRQQLSKGERIVKTRFTVSLFGTPDQIADAQEVLKSIYRIRQWVLEEETYTQLPAFLATLPMIWGNGMSRDLHQQKKLKTTISTEPANLVPIQGEWLGTKSPGMFLVGRRGEVFWWSPFDCEEGNYNTWCTGLSGSGKSVFMQELMTSIASTGGKSFVIDVGRSFEKTCKLLGGQYTEFSTKSDISLNPFTMIDESDEKVIEDNLSMLCPIFSIMADPTKSMDRIENGLLSQAINEAWKKNRTKATITDVAEWLKAQDNIRANELGIKLYPYTKDGAYGRFFNKPANMDYSKPIVVIELDELKEKKDLQDVVLQMFMIQITNSMILGKRDTPFLIMMDECWDLLSSEHSKGFIEMLARKLRKYRGALVLGTQSISDFYKNPAALAAFQNSQHGCLLAQKREAIKQLNDSKEIDLDPLMEEYFASIRTEQGKYSEIMLYGPHGYAVGRLLLDPYSLILYSTKAEHYQAVKEFEKKGYTLAEAVYEVAYGGKKT